MTTTIRWRLAVCYFCSYVDRYIRETLYRFTSAVRILQVKLSVAYCLSVEDASAHHTRIVCYM